MTQLTLMDAVNAGVQGQREGLQLRRAKREEAEAVRQDGILNEANAAAAKVFEESKTEWATNGAQGNYQPNELTMMRAAEARGLAFARAGDWGSFVKNSAAITGLRTQVRQRALERFEQDGDGEALVRTMHSTVFDGKKIKGIEKVDPTEAYKSDNLDIKARAGGFEVTFDDGSKKMVQVPELVKQVKLSLVDPADYAAKEAAHDLAMAQIRARRDANIDETRARGDEERKTVNRRGDIALNLEDVRFGNQRTLQSERLASEERQSGVRANATLGAARERGEGGGGPRANPELLNSQRITDLLTRAGVGDRDRVSGRYVPNALTQKARERVQQFMAQGDDYATAESKTLAEMRKFGKLPAVPEGAR